MLVELRRLMFEPAMLEKLAWLFVVLVNSDDMMAVCLYKFSVRAIFLIVIKNSYGASLEL